ncbi:MAG: sigma-70 family RNA polymerase sigma factor [Planctomycetes bacterium]|nr:sigma-70 family RNA polymerase sigma factor [Planctomycetota bacterium]
MKNGDSLMDPADNPTDAVQRAIAGDAVALTLLLTTHRRGIRDYIAGRIPSNLRGGIDADDLVQEAYAEVFRHIGGFESRGPDSFGRWIRTIALRKLRDAIKMRAADKHGGDKKQVHGVAPGIGESVVMLLDLMAGDEKSPSRCAASVEAVGAVRVALAMLPEDYQQAVTLVYLQGLTVKEAASGMNRTERAVHNLCYKAKSRLRELLGTESRFLSRG